MTDLAVQDTIAIKQQVSLAASGDEAAFASLVVEHHQAMARVAYVIAGDPESASDAVQAAWAIAWRRLRTLRDPDRVHAWLVAIAANEARGIARRRRRAAIVDLSAIGDRSTGGDPDDVIRQLDLTAALRALSPDDRTLIALRYIAGLDSGEIARHLGGSASGVRSRLARLLTKLRTELEPPEGTDR